MYFRSATSPLYFVIWVTTFAVFTRAAGYLRLCVVNSVHTGKIIATNCNHIKNDAINCIIASDRFECLRLLAHGRADFAVFEPEDLFASLSFPETHILLTHELRLFPNESTNYEMVVLVRSTVKSTSDLKDKRFCHPGYYTADNDWSPLFADYFQNQIIPKKCEVPLTLPENRFLALSQWFKTACIPGPWTFTQDESIDRDLKSKYDNLCAICANGPCHKTDKYSGRAGAVMCLTENAGDVAWVRLVDAKEQFKMAKVDTSKYRFLCPDGTPRPINSWGGACAWISRPWPVVAARRELVEKIGRIVDDLFDPEPEWQRLLLQLLEGYRATPIKLDTFKTPEDFLHQFAGLSSAYAMSTCYPSRTIRWCLASGVEDRKCQWLRHAALAYGLEPEINCLQQAGKNASIDAVARGSCDLYIVQPEEFVTAREKNLTSIAELTSSYLRNYNNIVILVKKTSKYQTIEDLQGTTACFPKYRSVAWNAFVRIMNNRTRDPIWNCSDQEAMSTFFESVVLPTADIPDDKLNVNTFQCLLTGPGDVAFLTYEERFRTYKDMRRICVEDVIDPECILTWSTWGSIMVRKDLPQVRRRELLFFLEQMNAWFGVNHPVPTPAMTLFKPYDTFPNVIFPELTLNIMQKATVPLPRPYSEIMEELSKVRSAHLACGARSSNSYDSTLISLIIFILINPLTIY